MGALYAEQVISSDEMSFGQLISWSAFDMSSALGITLGWLYTRGPTIEVVPSYTDLDNGTKEHKEHTYFIYRSRQFYDDS